MRTPLVIYGLAQAQQLRQNGGLALYDDGREPTETIARIGRDTLRRSGAGFEIRVCSQLEDAAEGADFALNRIRVGGIAGRARDERIAIEHGLAGQETTGPAGAAMALRTIPVTLQHARTVERVAPAAWFINFTNPVGLITQALMQHTSLQVTGICDTLIQTFRLIPTEYLFFYYSQRKAHENHTARGRQPRRRIGAAELRPVPEARESGLRPVTRHLSRLSAAAERFVYATRRASGFGVFGGAARV